MKTLSIPILLLATMLVGIADAQTVMPVPATTVALATTRDSDQMNYLILDLPVVDVPKDMKLEEAYLSLYMDATTSRSADTAGGETVTLEVYPYIGTTKGKLDTSKMGTSAMKRTVQVGTGKPVRVYVTDFVDAGIKNPTADRHLIVGSVSGDRTATFDVKSLPGTSNTKATLTVYFSRVEQAGAN